MLVLFLCQKCGLKKTGRPASEWFAFAISILTVANVIAILTGALLNKLGFKYTSLTGNGNFNC